MSEQDQLKQIQEIRNIMERSSRFISLSGLSGVFAGFFALAGALAFNLFINNRFSAGYRDFAKAIPIDLTNHLEIVAFCLADATTVIVLSLAFAVFFTTRRARHMGLKIWDSSARNMLLSLFVPLITGGIFCLYMLSYHWFGIIAPTTLIFYGLALLNAGKYTLDEIRWLGISEIILGIIGLNYIGYGITLWAIGFGVLHIIYGLVMYVKYEAKAKEKKYW